MDRSETFDRNKNDNQAERILSPEDYVEPRCLLCDDPYGHKTEVKAVPQQRIIEKMDEYMSRRDYDGAGRHLNYWLEEARLGRDLRGQLMLHNELAGHYRKIGDRERAIEHAEAALQMTAALGFEDSASGGTSYVNAATVFHAFGDPVRALGWFEKARKVYEADRGTSRALLGGLYNNMALCCCALEDYDQAFSLYERAMDTMAELPAGQLEQAITCLNKADALYKMRGPEESEREIRDLLDQAADLLSESHGAEEGYYAFVCEKCAPAFEYYGYFLDAENLKRRAEEIYARA